MKISNGTAHEITFYSENDTDTIGRKLVLKEGAKPIAVIGAGTDLNAVKGNAEAPSIICNIPIKGAVVFTGYDPLPEGYDLYIVSNLYRSAVKELGGDTSKLATVDGTVYAMASIRPIGCLGLAVG